MNMLPTLQLPVPDIRLEGSELGTHPGRGCSKGCP